MRLASRILMLFTLFTCLSNSVSAQNRNAAVDISSAGEGSWFRLNDKDSNRGMGVEETAFSVEMYVKLQSNNANDFNFFDFNTGRNRISFAYQEGNIFRVETNGDIGKWYWTLNANSSVNFLNNWVHVAFVYNGSSLVQVYINGERVINTSLTVNGSRVTDLYPKENNQSGDGNCYIGATSVFGIKGKAYVSEVRVWKTALTSSEVRKYYDEEVNKAHPEWGNLVRYYHGTKQHINSDKVTIDDVMGKYDAPVNNNSKTRIKDVYPPIKPPSFISSAFNIDFDANTCQTSDIDVDWASVASSSFGYETGNDVYYSLSRSKDNYNSEIYAGTSSYYKDTGVEPGDKIKYRLRTYWKVNGVKYYSDDQGYTNYGSIKEQYGAPANFTVSDDRCDKGVELNWTATDSPPKWRIYRSYNSNFSGASTVTSSLDGDERNFTHTNQSVERDIYYKVQAYGTGANGCSVSGTLTSAVKGRTSKTPEYPTNFAITEDVPKGEIKLTWANPSNNNADSWILRKSKSDGSDETSIDLGLGTTSYTDSDVESCQSYRYSIASKNECATDGVFSPVDKTGNLTRDLSNKITDLEVSKGYYPNSVRLEWEVDGSLSEIDRFRIYRTDAEKVDYKLIKVVDNDLIFDDETALGGQFYNYKVAGEVACNDNIIYTNEPSDLGFMIPFGVANGHVEYAGGNPVEGVTVNFEQQSESAGKSLYFDGTGFVNTNKEFMRPGKSDFTFETWIKTSSTKVGIFGNSDGDTRWEGGEKVLYLDNEGKLTFVGNGCGYIRTDTVINDNAWHHIALSYDYKSGTSVDYKVFLDGEQISTSGSNYKASRSGYTSQKVKIGRGNYSSNEAQNLFTGYMDEIRLWDRPLTAEEIKQSYRRFLSGNEDGLTFYYRCDEGVGSKIYDASHIGTDYNKNDASFGNGVSFNNDIPETSKLGVIATTDGYGDYTADYIPYASNGEIFRVTAAFGQHEFEPSSRSIYIGDGAQTHNGMDFTDISSFSVRGKVTYLNSEVPVEGVEVLVDGEQALGFDKKPVRTDAEGNYEISVPIGYHYISVQKDGHYFADGVYPPVNEFGDIELHEFTDDLTVNFTDSTKILVAGRIVGGSREGDKEIGFGLSLNNIGISNLKFKLQKEGYDLDLIDKQVYDQVSVTTDEYTGEFTIEMLPEQWVVQQVGNNDYSLDPEDLAVVDLRYSLDVLQAKDSTEVTSESGAVSYDVRTFDYHHKLNYIIQERPQIHVYGKNHSPFNGDSLLIFSNQVTGLQDTLDISGSNPFPYAVFQSPKTYEANVYVYQTYENPNHPDGPVVDRVPVEGAEITVTDGIAFQPTGQEGKTDDTGLFAYSFRAGLPNLAKDGDKSYTKSFEVDAKIDGIGYKWRENNPFRAYVLGAKPLEGTDFVSYGPEVVEMVLRDPPGSNSYAFIEKGSSFTKTETWSVNADTHTALNQTWHNGMYLGAGGGLAGPVIESRYQLDSEIGLAIERGFDDEGKYSEQWTFQERIETSSDPEDVGSDADLYIGKAYNAFITKTKTLKIIPKSYCIDNGLDYLDLAGSDMALGIIDGYAIDEGNTATYFIYSQKHIVEELLPELMVLRDRLLASDKYTSNFPYGHQFYGLDNENSSLDEYKTANPHLDPNTISYTFNGTSDEMDSVAFVNDQITQWMNALETNEAEKIEAETLKNLSIDGSGGKISEEIEESYTSEQNWRSSRLIRFTWNAAFGVQLNGKGYSMKNDFNVGLNLSHGKEKSINHNVKFGYVIDERDEGDYYSIDVKNTSGISLLNRSRFSGFLQKKKAFIEYQFARAGIGTAGVGVKTLAVKLAEKYTSKSHSFLATAGFLVDAGYFIYEMSDVLQNQMEIYDKQDGIKKDLDISGFRISSPIFSVRGGQSRCPYEGEEVASFYTVNNQATQLHTATLRRENPKLDVAPALRSNVLETEQAVFTLNLQNESESNTDMWYDISIAEDTNPDGAIVLIDGLTAERSFLVPAWETVNKTLTIQKGPSGILEYDSIGIILHSQCQFNPMDSQEDIADTVYVSAHFVPACSEVNLANFDENWIINYNDDNKATVTLDGYSLNHATLERVDFQYKSLSGDPIVVKAFFTDENSVAYQEYNGEKAPLDDPAETFVWDITDLTDREYQVRARAFCKDGSVTETDWALGRIDRATPRPFGKASPTDGILEAHDDMKITFNEDIVASLVRDNNIRLRGVLNGADLSHSVGLQLDGADDFVDLPALSLNNKSFTIEFWLRRDIGTEGVIFSKGTGDDKIEFAFENDKIKTTLGSNTFDVDPTPVYTVTYPENGWHHWAFSFNIETGQFLVFGDDKKVLDQTDINFNSVNTENAAFGKSASESGRNMNAKAHELRIWDRALSIGQVYENMSKTLSGNEIGLYAYWPLDAGIGNIAEDKAAGRHANVNATWFLEPAGQAFAFDGVSQRVDINGGNVAITKETDLTLEFWFKGEKPTATVSLFSHGSGEVNANEEINPVYGMDIQADATGQITIKNNGYIWTAVRDNHFDNDWHHFALTVDRRANAKVIIDGELADQIPGSSLSGLAGASFQLGARQRRLNTNNSLSVVTDQHFKGQMDEVRIWNSARTAKHLELYRHAKLKGDEIGLLAYYPFEAYINQQGAILLKPSLEDQLDSDVLSNDFVATANSGDTYSASGPAIKDVRPVQDIPFDFVVSDREIIITPIVDAYRIEGQVLEISVKDVQDLYGNRMLSPAIWTAYVQQNQVVWQDDALSFELEEGQGKAFTVSIVNKGGVAHDYDLENLPSWINVDAPSGTIQPNSNLELNFEIVEGLNIGYYEQGINLSTALGFDEKLNLKVKVTGAKPSWTVDEKDFEYTMNVYGQLIIDGIVSADEDDMVAAFVDGQCRGVANVRYIDALDAYEVFLNIYSNDAVNTENIELRIWDASKNSVHENVTPALTFEPNKIVGTVLSPIKIEAGEDIANDLALESGWNWISFNLYNPKMSKVNDILTDIGSDSDIIIGQNGYDLYTDGLGWMGILTTGDGLQIGKMYRIRLTEGSDLKLNGTPVSVDDYKISVKTGWNMIGFVPQMKMTVTEALASYQPSEGDLVKSHDAFAMYTESLGWIGSLKRLEPNAGYMLFSTHEGTIAFPRNALSSTARKASEDQIESFADMIPNRTSYEHNMSVIASVNGIEQLNSENLVLIAETNDLIKGATDFTELENGDKIFTLPILGNQNDEKLHFKLLDRSTGNEYEVVEEISFSKNAIVGSVNETLVLNLKNTITGISPEQENMTIAPNPFENRIQITLNGFGSNSVRVSLYSMLGEKLAEIPTKTDLSGIAVIDFGNDIPTGTYMLLVEGDGVFEKRLIIKK
ncbi:LamG-like jellyroll fold domain-containing protein [Fulvitalea axinellae]